MVDSEEFKGRKGFSLPSIVFNNKNKAQLIGPRGMAKRLSTCSIESDTTYGSTSSTIKSSSAVSRTDDETMSFDRFLPGDSRKRKRKVRFDSNRSFQQGGVVVGFDDLKSQLWWSGEEYQVRKFLDLRTVEEKDTAKAFLWECLQIREKLQIDMTSSFARGLEKYASGILLEGVRLSSYRGIESGALSDRCRRTSRVVKQVVREYHQTRPKTPRFSKSSYKRRIRLQHAEEFSTFVQSQTLPDRKWARVLALTDELVARGFEKQPEEKAEAESVQLVAIERLERSPEETANGSA